MEESVFINNKEIKEVVFDNYGMNVTNVKYINRGSSNIYNLDNKYILKEFKSRHNSEVVLKEVNIINHLKEKNKYPGHCGIYIGNYKFIHALRSEGSVVISNFQNKYWNKKLVATKDIISTL